jgi:N-acetylneuraminate lyase
MVMGVRSIESRHLQGQPQRAAETASSRFEGIWAALLTPFTEDGEVQLRTVGSLVAATRAQGLAGVYVGGTTGEGVHLSEAERMGLLEAVMAAAEDMRVMVHVGAANPLESRRLAQHAEKVDAAAIASIVPFVGGYTEGEVVAYYEQLADATALPLFVYYMPRATGGAGWGRPFLERLLHIPQVKGIKYTHTDLYALRQLAREGHTVMYGQDEMLCAGLLMGACGAIGSTYQLLGREAIALYRAHQAGDLAEMLRQQDRINDFVKVALEMPYLQALKYVLSLKGLSMGTCRFPRQALSAAQQGQLREVSARLGLV